MRFVAKNKTSSSCGQLFLTGAHMALPLFLCPSGGEPKLVYSHPFHADARTISCIPDVLPTTGLRFQLDRGSYSKLTVQDAKH